MAERRDYLSVCNDRGVPLTDFQAMFCVRCVQPECSRSRSGGLFETRVATWEERLFESPPRMPKDDPLYSVISAKRFIEVNTGRVPEVQGKSEWMDPRALDEAPPPVVKPRPARSPNAPTAPPPETTSLPSEGRPASRGLNTPFAQGVILNGGEGAPPSPKPVDRWASAPPSGPQTPDTPNAPIVKSGARIKFTG